MNKEENFKWKCDICGTGFNNFQAQGFDNKIYCPLCYFKHELNQYKNAWEENKNSTQEKHRNWCVNMSGAETKKEIKTCETYMKYWEEKLEELKELEQKYHLGGKE